MAIAAYENALKVYTHSKYPNYFTELKFFLGTAYNTLANVRDKEETVNLQLGCSGKHCKFTLW